MRLLSTLVVLTSLVNGCGSGGSSSTAPATEVPTDPDPDKDTDTDTDTGTPPVTVAGTLAIGTDITNIVITPQDLTGVSGNVQASSFYSVDASGQLGQLQIFTGGSGLTAVSQGTAKNFLQNDNYMFFVYSISPVTDCNVVVRRKSDGKMFCGGSPDTTTGTLYTGNRGQIQSDATGNIYFLESTPGTMTTKVVKVDVSNPDSPVKSTVHESDGTMNGMISGFLVGPSGDVFILTGSGSGTALIRKANGGIQNVAAASQVRMFIGSNGTFYWIKYGSTDITKLVRENNGSFTSSVHATNAVSNQAANLSKTICETQDELFGGDTGSVQASSNVFRLLGTPGTLNIAAQAYESWSDLRCATDRAYILGADSAGNGLIKSYKVADSSWATVLTAGDYTVYSFEINKSGVVFFTGLRNSGGAKVLARIDSPGAQPTIISSSFFKPEKLIPLN